MDDIKSIEQLREMPVVTVEQISRFRTAAFQLLLKQRKEIDISDALINSSNALLKSIPECVQHGDQCIPNAIEWINAAKNYENFVEPARAAASLEILRRVWQPHTQSNVDRMSEADIAAEIEREMT